MICTARKGVRCVEQAPAILHDLNSPEDFPKKNPVSTGLVIRQTKRPASSQASVLVEHLEPRLGVLGQNETGTMTNLF